MPLTKRFEKPKEVKRDNSPIFEDPKTRAAHNEYLRKYRKRIARLKYELSGDFLERPPHESETPES
jgi:hypothetical protein